MFKKDKLDKFWIDYFSRKIRNPIKKELFHKYINSDNLKIRGYETRFEAFSRLWKSSVSMARSQYGFNNKLGKTISQIASENFEESIYYKASIVDFLDRGRGKTIKEKLLSSDTFVYVERTKEFFKKYGNDKSPIENKSMNNLLDEYKNGEISKEDLNKYIKDFQKSNPEYNPSVYKKYNSASRDSRNYFD